MKRLLWLLPALLGLCGCQTLAALPTQTESAQPVILEMASPPASSPAPTEAATDVFPAALSAESTASAAEDPTERLPASATAEATAETAAPTAPDSIPVKSTQPALPTAVPATTEPAEAVSTEAAPQDIRNGDTTASWRPELAENYPPDADCSAALLLEKWMCVEGLTPADLEARACRQLILVVAQPTDGVESLIVCYEGSAEDGFSPVAGLERLHGFVGKNGIMHNRRRDTKTSPAGLWAISSAFGNEQPPDGLKLPWRQVTPYSEWVCDEGSPYFNTWQERGDPDLTPWSDDVEHLADYQSQYAWACVIEFNRAPDVVPSRGCAIFLHCSTGPTGGCVGLPRDAMRAVLCWLDADANPLILITGAA